MGKFYLCLLTLLPVLTSVGQFNQPERFRFAFYNVENLFHPTNDSLKRDDEFTPDGERHWSFRKYWDKQYRLSKVILALGRWDQPVVVGMCELENRQVVEDLVHKTPLKEFNYKIIHYESPDKRGIDVGMIYNADVFKPVFSKPIRVPLGGRPTRDILYVKGLLAGDTFHIFVNHWPSRYGGMMRTAPKRQIAANTLKHSMDSIYAKNKNAHIIAMGDYNDYPEDESMLSLTDDGKFYNFMASESMSGGSHKYKGHWGKLDQIIVSKHMVNSNWPSFSAGIFEAEFLLEEDKEVGKTTFRTFRGFKFHGGFSDHLPVYLDIDFSSDTP